MPETALQGTGKTSVFRIAPARESPRHIVILRAILPAIRLTRHQAMLEMAIPARALLTAVGIREARAIAS